MRVPLLRGEKFEIPCLMIIQKFPPVNALYRNTNLLFEYSIALYVFKSPLHTLLCYPGILSRKRRLLHKGTSFPNFLSLN